MAEKEGASASDESLKLAVAISLLRSKVLNSRKEPSASSPSESDAFRWKRKVRVEAFPCFSSESDAFPFGSVIFCVRNLRLRNESKRS